MISSLSAYGTGAALTTSERIEERSARASTSGSCAMTRLSGVGAVKVLVTRCSRTRSSQRAASKRRISTTVAPSVWLSATQASGPEW